MRSFVCLLLGAVCLAGCASQHSNARAFPQAASSKNPQDKIVVSPESSLIGSVIRVNESARFAVLNFPVGSTPGIGARMNIYRQGTKVGAIKITGPQLNENIVADVTDGSVDVGDQIRSN